MKFCLAWFSLTPTMFWTRKMQLGSVRPDGDFEDNIAVLIPMNCRPLACLMCTIKSEMQDELKAA